MRLDGYELLLQGHAQNCHYMGKISDNENIMPNSNHQINQLSSLKISQQFNTLRFSIMLLTSYRMITLITATLLGSLAPKSESHLHMRNQSLKILFSSMPMVVCNDETIGTSHSKFHLKKNLTKYQSLVKCRTHLYASSFRPSFQPLRCWSKRARVKALI